MLFLLAFPLTFVGCGDKGGFEQTEITQEDDQIVEEEDSSYEEDQKRMKESYN